MSEAEPLRQRVANALRAAMDPEPQFEPVTAEDVAKFWADKAAAEDELTDRQAEEAARAAAVAAAEAEDAAARATEPGDDIMEGEPPDDLDVDVTGLPPMRARLVAYDAWVAGLRARLADMEAGRVEFLRQMGVVAVTQAELDEMVAAEKRSWVKRILGGAVTATALPEIREQERVELEAKLKDQGYKAELARSAFAEVERRIELRKREIPVLAARRAAFVLDAILEHADLTRASRYSAAIAALQDTATDLMGLAVVVGTRRGYRDTFAPNETDLQLPRFGLDGLPGTARRDGLVTVGAPRWPSIRITPDDAERAALPWRELARTWASDPRADPEAVLQAAALAPAPRILPNAAEIEADEPESDPPTDETE